MTFIFIKTMSDDLLVQMAYSSLRTSFRIFQVNVRSFFSSVSNNLPSAESVWSTFKNMLMRNARKQFKSKLIKPLRTQTLA